MTNTQPIEKLSSWKNGSLEVHSVFKTIQGEGPCAGMPAIFVRLTGCNLQCLGCDTEYTSKRVRTGFKLLLDQCHALVQTKLDFFSNELHTPYLIVITGGEPFRQNILPFVQWARESGFSVQIETNGTYKIADEFEDLAEIVVSPKTAKLYHSTFKLLTALKYVVEHDQICPEDGLPLSVLGNYIRVARPEPYFLRSEIYVQPFDAGHEWLNKLNMQAAVDSCLLHGYRLCLQMHKIAGLD